MRIGNRVDYIDTAKGISICIIVLGHLVPEIFDVCPVIYCFWVPVFFVLSGVFYKTNDITFPKFLQKKVRSLLIPFISWYLISYFTFGIVKIIKKNEINEVLQSFSDIFMTNNIQNIPLWFLLSLFWCNLLLYVAKYFNNPTTFIFVIVITIFGYKIVGNPLYIGSAMSCMPYFYFGVLLGKRMKDSNADKTIIWGIIIVSIIIGLLCCLINSQPPRLVYYNNTIATGSPLLIYVCGISFVVAIVYISKLINRVPYITWLGRNSLIVLVTHCLIAPFTGTVIMRFWDSSLLGEVVNFAIILFLMPIVVLFCKMFLPLIIAQKKV